MTEFEPEATPSPASRRRLMMADLVFLVAGSAASLALGRYVIDRAQASPIASQLFSGRKLYVIWGDAVLFSAT